jgi:molecular chaperone IbpA
MTTLDLTPLFRSVVGFDRMANLLDSAMGPEDGGGYPPYNIERHSDEHYRITMALAGFKLDDLKIVVHEGMLTVQGSSKAAQEEGVTYLHRGIAARAFKRRFQLADSILVEGAHLQDGILHIELRREIPEAMKPREIAIQGSAGPASRETKTVEGTVATVASKTAKRLETDVQTTG